MSNNWKMTVIEPEANPAPDQPRILRTTFKVGRRYSCTITIDCDAMQGAGSVGQMRVEWEPDVPTSLNKKALKEYRQGRDALYAKAATVIGGSILIAE